MARLTTMPVAPPSACRNRAAISCGSVCASEQPMLAATIKREAREQHRPAAELVRQRPHDELRAGDADHVERHRHLRDRDVAAERRRQHGQRRHQHVERDRRDAGHRDQHQQHDLRGRDGIVRRRVGRFAHDAVHSVRSLLVEDSLVESDCSAMAHGGYGCFGMRPCRFREAGSSCSVARNKLRCHHPRRRMIQYSRAVSD